jgi:hypothetical protein
VDFDSFGDDKKDTFCLSRLLLDFVSIGNIENDKLLDFVSIRNIKRTANM